jgi:hypothetical protein
LTIARSYLWICLVASLVFGAAYLVAPAFMTGLMGIEHATPAGLTDLRATYAGFQLGMAALLAWCLRNPSRYPAGLVAFACAVGGIGLSRVIGLFVDGFAFEMAIATAIEFSMAGFALFALARCGSHPEAALRGDSSSGAKSPAC